VFIAALDPSLLNTDTNPTGLDGTLFTAALAAAVKDRDAFLHQFYADFYKTDETLGTRINSGIVESYWKTACSATGLLLSGSGDHLDNRLPDRCRQDRGLRHRRLDRPRDTARTYSLITP
jgi:hypothetical protein